jgi:hypothetical protein
MNENTEFGYKARQILNDGIDQLDNKTSRRLQEIRQTSLEHRYVSTAGLRLAGIGHIVGHETFSWLRNSVAILALVAGSVGTYYWNAFQDSREFEEIDSALLADELPPSAYLDRGFQAWLEHASHSSAQ